MRTRIILISTLAALMVVAVVTLSGGSDDSPAAGGRFHTVVAAFYPLAFAAQEIGGENLDVENLTPPGVEPHDLEATPDDVDELESADLDLLMGHDFQPVLEQAADQGSAGVVELLDTPGLDLRPDDPHVWLDPVRYELLVKRIADALGTPDAATPMLVRLKRLDGQYRRGLADCRRPEIVTSHEAFGYLAERYGLHQVAITGLSPEAEPSPAHLADVIDRVRSSGATTVFGETLLSPRLTDTVARETGARTAVLNPIEGLTPAEEAKGDDYFSLMRANLRALRKGLGCP
jgi:zinc transport system substrate-binding protein